MVYAAEHARFILYVQLASMFVANALLGVQVTTESKF